MRLSQVNKTLQGLTRTCVRKLHVFTFNITSKPFVQCAIQRFPMCRELTLFGGRINVFSALQGAQKMSKRLKSLTLVFKDFSEMDEAHMDGLALGALVGGFPKLETLSLRNLGPFSPKAFVSTLLTCPTLQTVQIHGCGTLMDSTVQFCVKHAKQLQHLTIDSCPSLQRLELESNTLCTLMLTRCFQLHIINTQLCPMLTVLDLPWTANMQHAPYFCSEAVQRISLLAAAKMSSLLLANCSHLQFLDVSYCVKLKEITLTECRNLMYLQCQFSRELETIELYQAHSLRVLDVSLLKQLETVVVTEAHALKHLRTDGCLKLKRIVRS